MNTSLKIKDLLLTIKDKHLALVNEDGKPYSYKIVEYIRTAEGIKPVQCKMGSIELMLDYAEHLTND